MGLYIVVIPKCMGGQGYVVGCRVNGTVFRADNTPTAFGLGGTHICNHIRTQPAHTGTVGYLIKTIFSRNWAYF